MDKPQEQWEWVTFDTSRLKVPSGWLYEIEHERYDQNGNKLIVANCVFVPVPPIDAPEGKAVPELEWPSDRDEPEGKS